MTESLYACRCGAVAIAAEGPPIAVPTCYCDDCQEAGRRLSALPGAPPLVGTDGGTGVVMQRKDRLRLVRGAEHLRALRLTPEAPTRRVVATCCNTPMFLDFRAGHWLSLYRDRLEGARPATDIRTMTKYRPAGVSFDDGIPSPATHTLGFYARLFGAWAAMRFRSPKLDWGTEPLDA